MRQRPGRYRLIVERRQAVLILHGTLRGSHTGLHAIWLEPDSQLRLKSGRRIEISVTDLVGDVAEFEGTGSVSDALI